MCRGCIREVGLSVLSVAVIDVDIRWWLSEVVVISLEVLNDLKRSTPHLDK